MAIRKVWIESAGEQAFAAGADIATALRGREPAVAASVVARRCVVAHNAGGAGGALTPRTEARMAAKKKRSMSKRKAAKKTTAAAASDEPRLLSGGNPQIPKADGDGPVQAYIAAMPGWKRDVGRRLDELIVRSAPGVQKFVRWNSPFYGMDGRGWFVSFHCFTKYVKVTFLRGSALKPLPPVESKDPDARYVHVYEDGHIDEAQFRSWVEQAAAIPGWIP
jgi:hypothetical protein